MTRAHRVQQSPASLGLALLLSLAGCTSTPEKSPPAPTAAVEAPAAVVQQSSVLAYPPPAHADLYSEVEQELLTGNWIEPRLALDSLPETMPDNDQAWRDYYLGWASWQQGRGEAANQLLDTAATYARDPSLQQRIGNLARHIATLQNDYLRSARLGLRQLTSLQDPDLRAALLREIWRALSLAPEDRRQAALREAKGDWRGWLELASLDRPDQSGPDLREQLLQWLDSHADHPATMALPGGLDFLVQSRSELRRIALLLPLSGELSAAAKAIRDGYLAQHYLSGQTEEQAALSIRFIDTANFADSSAAYQQAVAGGAQLIIGPLDRDAVDRLARQSQRRVPVIALNRSSEPAVQDGAAFLQLALSPDDEMRQLAALAFGQGARRALLVRPVGERGNRLAESLIKAWRGLGGSMADTLVYSNPEGWSDGLESVLHLHASKQRARGIRAMLATPIEHTPRRRADLDAIFMLTDKPVEARSLRPLLAFHYAGALPVYAPSSVHAGPPDHRDRDLNAVRIIEQPWLLGANPRARVAISAGNTEGDHYPRFNALGADAWLLQSRLEQLRAGPDALLRGNTGLLSLDAGLHIERTATAAEFDSGALKPL